MRWGRTEITAGALVLWAALFYLDQGGAVPQVLTACALHEGGHWLAIRLLGGRVAALRVTCVGAELRLSARHPMSPAGELLAALAGPAVNLLLALACAGLGEGWHCFAGLNLALGCFNLLPLAPLDGGRALGCLLALAGRPGWGAGVARVLSAALCGGLLTGALLLWQAGVPNLTLPCLAVWLLWGAVGRPAKK